MAMEVSLTSLPNEVLAVVFSHLDVKDRLQASLVCKKWLHLINCRPLLNDIAVSISDNEQIHTFSATSRKFKSFYFFKILIDNNSRDLFKYIAPHVETLQFFNCDLERKELVSFGDLSFNNLKSLVVADCDLWCIFPALPNLTHLYLAGTSTITDDGIAILQKNLKNLKILIISCNIVCDRKVYRRFYPNGMTYEKNPSSAILSYLGIQSFISEIASTLCEIDFCSNQLTALALKELAGIKELKLNKIIMYDVSKCHKSLIDLFKMQTNLKIVHLERAVILDDNTIDTLCTSLPNIIELELISCEITDNALKKIFQLDQLKKISLSYCQGLTPPGFYKAMSDFKPIQVKYLNLSHIAIPKDSIPFIQRWSFLVHLDISACQVVDSHIHAISTFLINLQDLNLANNDITDCGIAGISVANYGHGISAEFIEPLYNLKDLRLLHLDGCHNLTDAGLITAIRFPFLKVLDLTGINILKETISVLQSQNKNLKKVFSECYYE